MHNHADLQLMNQIVAMVTEKKRSSSMGTLTSTAVRMKSSRMKTRLPAIRIVSDILKPETSSHLTRNTPRYTLQTVRGTFK